MITLATEDTCTGCEACRQVCSRHSISMLQKVDGFLYPHIDMDLCVECHLCESACPQLNVLDRHTPIVAYAARSNKDERNGLSSSGGIFPIIAKYIISQKGVVFGAKFNDNFQVVHSFAETEQELMQFYGAKYVQSQIGNSFLRAKEFLKAGRLVLFSGTPCQIFGLKSYLGMEYNNLFTIDLICKGVPSPRIWSDYLKELCLNTNITFNSIQRINFRDKILGWKNYSLKLDFGSQSFSLSKGNCEYLQGFYSGLYTRSSCSNCSLKSLYQSDIRIGDAWGLNFDRWTDNRGISIVIVNSSKGLELLSLIPFDKVEVEMTAILQHNPACERPFPAHRERNRFLAKHHDSLIRDIHTALRVPVMTKITRRIKRILKYK